MRPKPLLLLILDGWGYRDALADNAISGAPTPVWDHLWKDYPHSLIATSGRAVGLPDEQMGNSEVGHMNIGAGRIVYQDFTRITAAIEDGSFFRNSVLNDAMTSTRQSDGAVHLMGLLSPGGVHSHEQHLFATVDLALQCGVERLYVHAFLDGRDTPPKSAADSIEKLQAKLAESGRGRIASLVGRYYAMDRDQRWDRVEVAYRLLTEGRAEFSASSALEGLQQAYQRGESDEFVKPTAIVAPAAGSVTIRDGDSVIFMNFRADRARELARAFVEPSFSSFKRISPPVLSDFVCLTEYQDDIPAPVAFPPLELRESFGEVVANYDMRQLRIAETEKYAHVTFFFNGGQEKSFVGEDRILVPSPKVATYDLQPEMSAVQVTDRLLDAIRGDDYDVIICNYANPDMLGHTGNYAAAVQAIITVDQCLGRLYSAVRAVGGELLITADHGNAELMRDPATGQPHTAHTTGPVPLVYVGRSAVLAADGALCDIAPTLLALLGLAQPQVMTGRSLVSLNS